MNNRCAGDGYYGTAGASGGPVSLYIHFPFCVRKCRYCDFLSGPSEEETRQRYLDALDREIRSKSEWLGRIHGALPEVDTIYIGGGTPSLMTPRQLDHLMFLLSSCFLVEDDAEITMECNPGTADDKKLQAFYSCGVNRLSIGVQSFRDEELQLLGRIHTAQEARHCVDAARRAGFANISLDLMSALPGQSYAQWMENLAAAVEQEPDHISAYSLIIEEGTPFHDAQESGALPCLPEEDEDRRMYHDTKAFLAQHGYRRYEISNYARPGFESRHNIGYWTGHPYLGLGLGASSYIILIGENEDLWAQEPFSRMNNPYGTSLDDLIFGKERRHKAARRIRWSNPASMDEYLTAAAETEGIVRKAEVLSARDQMAEFMFLGLRRTKGVSERDFAAEFGRTLDEVYAEVIRRYCALGLLERDGGYLRLTDPGIDVSNTVMADFL